jgi:hypothetical protein
LKRSKIRLSAKKARSYASANNGASTATAMANRKVQEVIDLNDTEMEKEEEEKEVEVITHTNPKTSKKKAKVISKVTITTTGFPSAKTNQETKKTSTEPKEGNLKYDIPVKVVAAKMKDGEVACEVEWAKRYDGSQPLNSRVSNKDLKDKYPCLLID